MRLEIITGVVIDLRCNNAGNVLIPMSFFSPGKTKGGDRDRSAFQGVFSLTTRIVERAENVARAGSCTSADRRHKWIVRTRSMLGETIRFEVTQHLPEATVQQLKKSAAARKHRTISARGYGG